MTELRKTGGALRSEAGTPQTLFDVLNKEYMFTVDVCASDLNHKLPFYWTKGMNSLSFGWGSMFRAWCNPPYNDIPPWLAHCDEPELVAYLLPVRTDRNWWRQYKPRAECHYFVGEKPHRRIQFVPPPGVKYSSNADCNVLFLFGQGCTAGLEVYRSGLTGERL